MDADSEDADEIFHDGDDSSGDDDEYHSPVENELEDSEDAWDVPQDSEEARSSPEEASENAQMFDINRAGRHEYLGKDLDEVSGFTFYEENSIQKIPVIEHQTVSFPGQKIPFNIFQQSLISMVLSVMEGDKTFGLVLNLNRYNQNIKSCVGVTFQIMNSSAVIEGHCQLTGMCRQRFRIIEATKNNELVMSATVRILPEKLIVPFYTSITSNAKDSSRTDRKRKLNASIRTPWPTFVYEQYNEQILVSRIHALLKDLCRGQLSPTQPPTDPLMLSYWVAHNLPLVDQQRTLLLKLDCPTQRLRWELHFMAKCSRICCSTCGQQVSNTSSVFSMSTDGPQGAYVNPDGFVHDTLTVRHANNLVPQGTPSARFSWFPGYKWVCVFCHSCYAHIGWRFESGGKLVPAAFWGLTRKALVTMPEEKSDSEAGGFDLRPII